jgi:hypothetical protein
MNQGSLESWNEKNRKWEMADTPFIGVHKAIAIESADISFMKKKIDTLPEGNKERSLRLLKDELEKISKAKGSSAKHHAFEGGYANHVADTMRIADKLYHSLSCFDLPFTLQDVYLVLFLHDLEKAWKYFPPFPKISKDENENFRQKIIEQYGFELTEEHKNALRHIEIEKDYNPTTRTQGPLAAFCHVCDVLSARLFYSGI